MTYIVNNYIVLSHALKISHIIHVYIALYIFTNAHIPSRDNVNAFAVE